MSPIAISGIIFACVFGGALLGMSLRALLPEHHLSVESRDLVKLGMGLIATMAALVLGLLIASVQGSFGAQRSELTQLSTDIILLDRVLAHYGPETQDARELLRSGVVRALAQTWPEDGSRPGQQEPTPVGAEALYDKIQALAPQNEAQRSLQARALSMSTDIGKARWLMFEQRGSSIPTVFLMALVFWLTIIFVSFGLHAPPNAIVIATLFIAALSVSGAIFLILEMDLPFEGLIRIPSAPLRSALAHLGQ